MANAMRNGGVLSWDELERGVRAHLERREWDAAATLAIGKLGHTMLSYVSTMLAEEDAQDALSIFRETLWKALPRFRWECSLRAWAYRLAHHAATRILRRPHRRYEEHLPSSAPVRLAAPSLASGLRFSGRHEGLALLRASLSIEDRELLTLRVDRELEWDEVAVVLTGDDPAARAQSSPMALRKRYERLTRKLERMAREQGLLD